MNGISLLLDTNIALYLLSGDPIIKEVLDGNVLHISVITEMELRAYPSLSVDEAQKIKDFCEELEIISLGHQIKEKAIEVRSNFKLKLPDSIIAATSLHAEIPLITADKAFEKISDISLILYEPGNPIF